MIKYRFSGPIRLYPDIPEGAREWRNDYDIRRWCRQNSMISRAEHEDWLRRQHEDPSIKMFGISNGVKSVGVCGFTSIDRLNRSAEFSLYISMNHKGEGYGINALRTLCAHGFRDWGFHRIWGEVFDGNPALKTFLDAGFHQEGVLRQAYFREGKFIDAHRIAVLAEEWKCS
jgi:RimJ/RimL family protein N-acetyltransferase